MGEEESDMIRPSGRVFMLRAGAFLLLSQILLVIVFAGRAPAGRDKHPTEAPEALVAIGDVHGDFDDFVAILQRAGLIDPQKHWIGGKTTFVQVGDLLDRGPKPRQVMDLMMSVEKEAPQAGGQVVGLLGNHEMMNIMGDLRYVTPENYFSYAQSNSEQRRKDAFQQYMKWRNSHLQLIAELPQPMELTEAEWMARHLPGYVEQREAFSRKGEYGAWLRQHSPVANIGGDIFLHGGISPNVAHMKIDAINSRVRDEIQTFDEIKEYLQGQGVILPFFNLQEMTLAVQAELAAERKQRVPTDQQSQARLLQFLGYGEWLSVKVDGPLWFRGYDQWSDDEGNAQISKVLEGYNAAHIVVGHTVQKGGRMRPRFGNRVFLIDTGMLSSYYPGGKASALEVCGEARFTAKYMDEQTVLLEPAGSSPQNGAAAATGAADPTKAEKPANVPVSGGICAVAPAVVQ
jgi:hypothetical protein